ncbi:tRNA methyltransferase 10 homolog A-like isoform X3 [Vespa mandarinia]|uniref:tRNA methyltransferase 10 homolog A-like isoform X3 n=1 Tax=Vespa mandarinia TaxID=7446 RepID=UPI00160E52DB|nr:tRNA methyltransferase 10 homolog A-like isoform X3 [Vespa mandarinia]
MENIENINRLDGEAMDYVENRIDNNKVSHLEKNLSKRQLKRAKKTEKWLERKNEKRRLERAKAREKRAFARANNIDLGPSRKALKRSTMAESSCKLTVTIDLSFDDLMIDKDIAKLIKQILRCYTLNRRAIAPLQFSLTSFNGKSKKEMEKHNGYEHWDITGGLVDHNCHKGLCHKLAMENGIKHGRLPLDKFLLMKARKVLTIDHGKKKKKEIKIFEILLRITEGKTWQEAFLQVLPERKRAQPITFPPKKSEECKTMNDIKIEKDCDEDMCNNIENVFKQE